MKQFTIGVIAGITICCVINSAYESGYNEGYSNCKKEQSGKTIKPRKKSLFDLSRYKFNVNIERNEQ